MPGILNSSSGFLDFLLEQGKLTPENHSVLLAEFAEADISALERALIERHFLSEEDLATVKATSLGMEFVDLLGMKIDSDTLTIIPKSVAENYGTVAYAQDGTKVKVAYVDPLNNAAVEAIGFLMAERNLQAIPFVTTQSSYNYALKQYGALRKEVAKVLEKAKEEEKDEEKSKTEESTEIEETIKGAPVSRIVSVIMRYAVESKASDIHVETWQRQTRVRYRVDGVLRTLLTLPRHLHDAIVSRIKVLANLKIDETRIPQDGRISQTIGGKNIDFRISTFPTIGGEKIVMRVLDTSKGVPSLEQLGFRSRYREILMKMIKLPHGMMLITGPTGSGKSTTLFTLLSLTNDEGLNISTLEDPVEYFLPGANQSQVRPEVGYTFASGLRALLRQDPNVIMVGEIRDKETGELAVHAALTGHLIFSTIHTNDAMGVVPRMMDMGIEPFLLSSTLNIIVAQRLARKICEHCAEDVKLPEKMERLVRDDLRDIPSKYLPHEVTPDGPITFKQGKGCVRCGDTGYVGRVAIAELILMTPELRLLVNDGFPADKVNEELTKQDFLTMRQDAILKVIEGVTTVEEVLRLSKE